MLTPDNMQTNRCRHTLLSPEVGNFRPLHTHYLPWPLTPGACDLLVGQNSLLLLLFPFYWLVRLSLYAKLCSFGNVERIGEDDGDTKTGKESRMKGREKRTRRNRGWGVKHRKRRTRILISILTLEEHWYWCMPHFLDISNSTVYLYNVWKKNFKVLYISKDINTIKQTKNELKQYIQKIKIIEIERESIEKSTKTNILLSVKCQSEKIRPKKKKKKW